MTDTFAAPGPVVWSPVAITADNLRRDTRTIVQDLIGESTPAVSFLPALSRAGTIELLAQNAASAAAGLALFSLPSPITLTSTGRPDLNMRFVVTGEIIQSTDTSDESGSTSLRVILTVPIREIPA